MEQQKEETAHRCLSRIPCGDADSTHVLPRLAYGSPQGCIAWAAYMEHHNPSDFFLRGMQAISRLRQRL